MGSAVTASHAGNDIAGLDAASKPWWCWAPTGTRHFGGPAGRDPSAPSWTARALTRTRPRTSSVCSSVVWRCRRLHTLPTGLVFGIALPYAGTLPRRRSDFPSDGPVQSRQLWVQQRDEQWV